MPAPNVIPGAVNEGPSCIDVAELGSMRYVVCAVVAAWIALRDGNGING